MGSSLWTGGHSVTDRPLCVLVHYLVCLNVLCLVAAQLLLTLLFGPRAFVGALWMGGSLVLVLAHVAFALLFAWIDGEALRGEGGAEVEMEVGSGDGASGSDGGSDGGGSGD